MKVDGKAFDVSIADVIELSSSDDEFEFWRPDDFIYRLKPINYNLL
jgi:hypothetical protein